MPFQRVRDLEMYYELQGSGPRLLFIGGTGGDLRQKPSLSDGPLADAFSLLAYDQRGLGRTSKPAGPYTMADYADDAAALIEAVGWTRAHVVGVSFGGMVAQHLAIRHPARVERLVLACTSSGGEGGASYPLHTLAELPEAERLPHSLEISDTRCDAAWREREPEAYEGIAKLMSARGLVAGGDAEAQAVAERGAALQLDARRRHDAWAGLPEIAAPTYVCGGRYDGIAPPANLKAIAARIPKARLELFEGGHLFLMQDAKALPEIVRFLSAG